MKNKRPDNWGTFARQVKKRDNYHCNNCNYKGSKGDGKMNAHHIVPLEDGGSKNMSNIITLCDECHNTIHYNRYYVPTSTQSSNSKREFGPIGKVFARYICASGAWFWPLLILFQDVEFSAIAASVLAALTLLFLYWFYKNNKEKIDSHYEEHHAR